MIRSLSVGVLALLGIVGGAPVAQADVNVRVPFVRVYVGDGVHVRAPFVNVWVPGTPPVYVAEPPPPIPPPTPLPGSTQAQTLKEFVDNFQPRGGTFDVMLVNPLTGAATPVRFTLPAGAPRRLVVNPQEIEFIYGLRHFVRIQFDRDGATVFSR
jgi:hypothetical protein